MKLQKAALLRLIRWHRRTGILLALFLVLLASTGILINHAKELNFDQPVNNALILAWYGVNTPDQVEGVHTSNGWISQVGTGLYWENKRVAQCNEHAFVGAFWLSSQFILSCKNELIVLDAEGEIEETFSVLYGLPVPVTGLSKNASDDILIRVDSDGNGSQLYLFDLDGAQWILQKSQPSLFWSSLVSVPGDLKKILVNSYSGSDISWERVLLDLHSGRLFGQIGVWVMDIVAIAMLVLALSGLWLWRMRATPK